MGEARSNSLYTKDNSRVSDTFCSKTSLDVPLTTCSSELQHKTFSSDDLTNRGTEKTWNFGKANFFDTRFLLTNVSSKKERWWRQTYFRPSGVEQICDYKTFSPHKPCYSSRVSPTRRLVDKNRYFSGLFPFAYSTIPQTFFETLLQARNASNDLTSIWPIIGPETFLCSNLLGCGDSSQERDASPGLSRRFFAGQPGPHQVKVTGLGGYDDLGNPRMACEPKKINNMPNKVSRIPRHQLEYGEKCDVSTFQKAVKNFCCPEKDFSHRRLQSSATTVPTGATKFRLFCDTARATSLSPLADHSKAIFSKSGKDKNIYTSEGSKRSGMVARSPILDSADSFDEHISFSNHRRLGHRVGCRTGQKDHVRVMGSSSETLALQQKRDVCCIVCCEGSGRKSQGLSCTFTDRQQNCHGIHPQRRRHSVHRTTISDVSSSQAARQVEHHTFCPISARQIQCHSRPSVAETSGTRMALITKSNRGGLRTLGHARHRPFRFKKVRYSARLCNNRFTRQFRKIRRRLFKRLELSTGMDISPSKSNSKSALASKQGEGDVLVGNTGLGTTILESGSPGAHARRSNDNSQLTKSVGRPYNGTSTSTSRPVNPEDLENWGWGDKLALWSQAEKDLLKRSWRQSTLGTYLPALKRWIAWCEAKEADSKSPKSEEVAQFLADTFLKEGYAYSTMLVQKSAVATFCGQSSEISSNFMVKQVLKAIHNSKPPNFKAPIWDVRQVVEWLKQEPKNKSLFEIARRTATILLLTSGRRLHDLTLLRISKPHFSDNGQEIILWPVFGAKTDNGSRRQSGWKLLVNEDSNLCPVTWVRLLIQATQNRRTKNEVNHLFISIKGIPKPASRTLIGGWVRSVLKDAGIDASPGSCRSAVASLAWLENRPVEEILERGNWTAVQTMRKYYCREINNTQERDNENNLFNNFQSI